MSLAFAALGLLLLMLLLTPVRAFGGSLTLAWDPVSSPALAGYVLSYGTVAGSYTASIDVGNATSRSVPNLTEGSTYHFAVQAYDTSGTRSGFSNDVGAVVPSSTPVAAFSASTTSGPAPLALNFINSSTGNITSYSWSFGDGTTSTSQSPAKTYSSAGTYSVSLTVTGPGGTNTKTNANYITVTSAPVANFTASTTSGGAPLTVNFTSTSTGTISSYSWSFGDGTTSTAQNPSKVYSTAGTYSVSLTVTGSGGSNTKTSTNYITVSSAPIANFTASTTSGAAPLTVNFTSTSTGTIGSYSWNFGDGSTSTAQNPSKVYSTAGTYTVSLTVTGSGGSNTKTNTNYITVNTGGDTSAPTAPASLSATASGSSGINLSWTASTDNLGVTGYRIERCQGAGCSNFAQIATSSTTSFSNGSLSATTAYSYRVRATDAAGNLSGYSNVASATTAASTSVPVASFTASATSGVAPLIVDFTSTSTGSITAYSWNFGDGTSSTAQNPSKTYSTPGTYSVSLTVSGSGGSNIQTKTGLITVTSGTTVSTGGSLTGSVSTRTSDTNLSTVGTEDWVLTLGSVPIRKATGGARIGAYAVVVGSSAYTYGGDPRTLTWNDGSPTTSGSTDSGAAISGTGAGFSISAPADKTSRTLRIYAGAVSASGKLTARLSDGSAADFVSTITPTKTGRYNVVYTLTYKAASVGQTITVTWTQASGAVTSWSWGGRRGGGSTGSVTLQGAALRVNP